MKERERDAESERHLSTCNVSINNAIVTGTSADSIDIEIVHAVRSISNTNELESER